MAEWEIKKADGVCHGTGRELSPGEEFFAALVETDEGFERRDYCAEFWEKQKPEVYCFWKTTLPDPDKKKKLLIDDDMLMTFFERLGEETEQDKINFRFVLTLILMRKKKLKYDSVKVQGGNEVWKLKVSGEKKYVEVINPHLSEDQIEDLSSQVGQIMQLDMEDD